MRVLRASLLIAVMLVISPAMAIEPARQAQLKHLLIQDCGSCHGMTLKGGLGPALLPANLAGKPDNVLVTVILDGRTGTAMPPWSGLLSEEEVVWLIELLRQGVD